MLCLSLVPHSHGVNSNYKNFGSCYQVSQLTKFSTGGYVTIGQLARRKLKLRNCETKETKGGMDNGKTLLLTTIRS